MSGSNLTWTGDLAAGASATITFSVTVNNPDTGNKSLASTITSATAGSNCASGSTDTRCASTVTVLVPGLTTTVSAGTSTTTPGSVVQYTVTVTNSGQTAYTGATFTNPLGGLLDDSTYNNDAAATAGSVSFASSSLTWTGNLAVGATATVTFSVTVKDPDTGDKVLVDTITSTTAGSNCPAGSTDSRCTATVPVLVSGLQISASAGSATTAPGSVVQYTVTVTNSGQTAYTGATFTDPLSGVLDDASYNNNAAATSGSVSFASPNLTWTGDLAVGRERDDHVLGDGEQTRHRQQDPGQHDHLDDTRQQLRGRERRSALHHERARRGADHHQHRGRRHHHSGRGRSGSPAPSPTPGRSPTPGSRSRRSVTDVRDDASSNGDSTATSGTLSVTNTGLTWTGNIPVGGSVTISGSVTVNTPDTGNKVLVNTLSTAAAGSNCPSGSTDPACSVSVPVLTPALTIVTTANAAAAAPGQPDHRHGHRDQHRPDPLFGRGGKRLPGRLPWTTPPTTTTPPPPPDR